MARAQAARQRARSGGRWLWLQGMICGCVVAFASPVAVMTGVLMAPAVLALMLEDRPGQPVARAVALACATFTLAPLWHLIVAGRTMDMAVEQLEDPSVTGLAWLSGACGWAMCVLLPVLLRGLAEMRATARIAALEAERARVTAEWDLT